MYTADFNSQNQTNPNNDRRLEEAWETMTCSRFHRRGERAREREYTMMRRNKIPRAFLQKEKLHLVLGFEDPQDFAVVVLQLRPRTALSSASASSSESSSSSSPEEIAAASS